jgi:hypothetical protein
MNILKVVGFGFVILLLVMSCSSDTPFEAANNTPPQNNTLSKFSEIQAQIFTTTCALSGCHDGSSLVTSLNLSSGKAYNALVNVNSAEKPNLKLVNPGNSDDSYLIHKLTGNDIAGLQMPYGGTPLLKATIDSIARWIDDGAPNN